MALMEMGIDITDDHIQELAELEGWTFCEDRKHILKSMNSIDVQACPGSGKTTLIAAKLILLSQQWSDHSRGICVFSHTNVAKNEIIGRLSKSNIANAKRLLSYPHFIGTIQEFVDRFIALPYIRNKREGNITIDNEIYTDLAWSYLSHRKFSWLKGTLNGLGGEAKQRSFLENTFLCLDDAKVPFVNMYPANNAWNKTENLNKAKCLLMDLKRQLAKARTYLFRDMFTLSMLAFKQTPVLSDIISNRFPLVFIDEMQDTQLHQDEVLLQAFSSSDCKSVIQRFGDPDQAIFHGSGTEKPNKSYNDKTNLDFVVNTSHRFNNDIASQIKCLSLNQVELTSALSEEERNRTVSECLCASGFQNTIIVHDCDSRHLVIEKFASIVDDQFPERAKSQDDLIVKIVGAVGKPIQKDTDLKISSYWAHYEKEKSQQSFKASTLLSAVLHCQTQNETDWNARYQVMIKGVLKLLVILGEKHSTYTLKKVLTDKDDCSWQAFRNLVLGALLMPGAVIENWDDWVSNLLNVLKIESSDLSAKASAFLSTNYSSPHGQAVKVTTGETGDLTPFGNNCLRVTAGFTLEFSTIHGVKGETHDATLVLPTKFHDIDMQKMLPHLGRENGTAREQLGVRTTKFMKQFYVAASRPRHLLCLAINKEYLCDESEEKLKQKGWVIVDASTATRRA